jgi:hypothetical protein
MFGEAIDDPQMPNQHDLGEVVDGDRRKALLGQALIKQQCAHLDKLFDEQHDLGGLVMAVTGIQHSPRIRLVDAHGDQPRPHRGLLRAWAPGAPVLDWRPADPSLSGAGASGHGSRRTTCRPGPRCPCQSARSAE